MKKENLELSVIIPSYNEEKFIKKTVLDLDDYLIEKNIDYEIIVINDGSTDTTQKLLDELKIVKQNLIILKNKINKGKGYSIKRGIFESKGKFVLFFDADLTFHVHNIGKLYNQCKNGLDIVIGSRVIKGTEITEKVPRPRLLLSSTFLFFTRLLVIRDFLDTQCGIKCFRGEIARELFKKQSINRFAFDVEILYLANKKNCRITEVPVSLSHYSEGSVNIIKDSINMFGSLFLIRINDLLGKYK
jgi:dolichyl-phosphate beta-glucosyltransferase|tara:strand:+ start:776 stop:1510 length:735 start_codon:yes stop_codon:yes gene_type:complete